MNEPLPKFSSITHERVFPNPFLAGKRSTDAFQKAYCERILSRHFPELDCSNFGTSKWAPVEPNDKVEDLVRNWAPSIERDLLKIPVKGETTFPLWSDDYWKTRYGGLSFRYASGKYFNNYKEAIGAYTQPIAWSLLNLELSDPLKVSERIREWSPSEKYDLSLGEENFGLTNAQKKEGESVLGENGDVESWMGICHGWSAAAIMVPPPMKAVSVFGPKGSSVLWYPHEIRALASLSWANGLSRNGFVGGRCNAKNAETHPNGRLKDPNCFDNNPATFHLALGNLIGIQKGSFIMDASFDYEVWNQPIHSYEFTYFNPLDVSKKSTVWSEVAVPYDAAFKEKDRFQKPLTRGPNVKSVVGAIAKVTYLSEVRPIPEPKPRDPELVSVFYTYDLEIGEENGKLVPTGGEWHTNFHPDFLWVPEKGEVAISAHDAVRIEFTGKEKPGADVVALAEKASRLNMPLCKPLAYLVNESNGGDVKYKCP